MRRDPDFLAAAVCIHQRPIAGDTNENSAMPALLAELMATYDRSRLFEVAAPMARTARWSPHRLSPDHALALSRAHWCREDARCTGRPTPSYARTAVGWPGRGIRPWVLAVSVLTMMALAIPAVARRLSRIGDALETSSWAQVAENFLLLPCVSILRTEAFDAFQALPRSWLESVLSSIPLPFGRSNGAVRLAVHVDALKGRCWGCHATERVSHMATRWRCAGAMVSSRTWSRPGSLADLPR